jgi:hypothetical protein
VLSAGKSGARRGEHRGQNGENEDERKQAPHPNPSLIGGSCRRDGPCAVDQPVKRRKRMICWTIRVGAPSQAGSASRSQECGVDSRTCQARDFWRSGNARQGGRMFARLWEGLSEGFRLALVLENGEPADPGVLATVIPTWAAGNTFLCGSDLAA